MNEVYKAIFDRLVSQIAENVYDHVPQDLADSDYPFVRIDPISSVNADVDDKPAFAATVQFVSFSRYRGSKEIEDLADSIFTAMNRFEFPATANYGISDFSEDFRRIVTQSDGLTRNAVQQYQLLFEPLTPP